MEAAIKKFRYLCPQVHDRVMYLLALTEAVPDVDTVDSVMQSLSAIKVTRNREKFQEILNKLEMFAMKSKNFNFIVYNIPDAAPQSGSSDDTLVKVGYSNLRATLARFGKIKRFEIIRGTAYAQFENMEDCQQTHALINNMMLGKNILQTAVVGC